jgi:hypothetical protein
VCKSPQFAVLAREVFKADPIRPFYGFCQFSFSVRIFLFSPLLVVHCFFTSHHGRLIVFEIESNGRSFPFTRVKYHQRKHPFNNADCVVIVQFFSFCCSPNCCVFYFLAAARVAEMAELCNQLVRRATRVAFCAPCNEVAAAASRCDVKYQLFARRTALFASFIANSVRTAMS